MLDDACTQYQLMLTENKFSASDYTTFINYFPLDNIFTLIMGFAAVALEHSPPSIFPLPGIASTTFWRATTRVF